MLSAGVEQCSRDNVASRRIWGGGGRVGFTQAEIPAVKGIWQHAVL